MHSSVKRLRLKKEPFYKERDEVERKNLMKNWPIFQKKSLLCMFMRRERNKN